jgi:hypothetical protein
MIEFVLGIYILKKHIIQVFYLLKTYIIKNQRHWFQYAQTCGLLMNKF